MQTVRKPFALVPQISGRWLERLRGPADATLADHLFRLLTVSVILLGLWLRCRGILFGPTLPLWSDESTWLVFLKTQPLTTLFIRPIAFMGLTKVLVALFPPTEFVVRFLPWLGGLATVLLSPALARRLCQSNMARLLLIASIALHPAAIDLGRDFKPYSLGLTVHIGLLILAFNYVVRGRARDLYLVLGVAMLGVLFAQDIVFIYPGLFLTLFVVAWKQARKPHLLAIAASAVVTVGILVTLYLMIWRNLDQQGEKDYWGARYDVFYIPDSGRGSSYVGWLSNKFADVLAMPGMRRDHWQSVEATDGPRPLGASLDRALWIGFAVVGAAVLVRRRRFYEILLLLGPLAVLMAFNAAGRWPFGAFRTNLFLLAYVTPLTALAFDLRRRSTTAVVTATAATAPTATAAATETTATAPTKWWTPLPALAFVVLPFFALNKHFHTYKHTFSATSYFPDVIQHLVDAQSKDPRGRELLLMDTRSCADWRYYVRYHPRFAAQREEIENDRFSVKCGKSTRKMLLRAASEIGRGERIWGVATGDRQKEELDYRLRGLRTIDEMRFSDQQIVVGVERR